MDRIQDMLSSTGDLLLVVLGFSLIIIIHEAGHFVAARWAGIRVLAFAVGFGPALFSYRKGLGFRRGSSEPEYNKLLAEAKSRGTSLTMSSTEYRLNVLPFGGYVKMLGQDDADPTAASNEPDSYQNCPPLKRMVVISAGVVFNIITAAILFMVVFSPYVGLQNEPARIGAVVDEDRPAAKAFPENAAQVGVKEAGLRPGDRILSINGETPAHFNDFSLAVAMARKGEPISLEVERPGIKVPLHFKIVPEPDPGSGMLSIGVQPMASDKIGVGSRRFQEETRQTLKLIGLPGIEPGARLVRVADQPANSPYELDAAVEKSGGRPVPVIFEQNRRQVSAELRPRPEFQKTIVPASKDGVVPPVVVRHLAGLTPAIAVESVEDGLPAKAGGVKEGDVFARLGEVEWPSIAAGIAQIRTHKDSPIRVVVLRQVDPGVWKEVDLGMLRPTTDGRLGFGHSDSASLTNVLASWPVAEVSTPTPSGAGLPILPGSRILEVNGKKTATIGEVRDAVQDAIKAGSTKVRLTVELMAHNDAAHPTVRESVDWTILPDEARAVASLGWENPLSPRIFEPAHFLWKADSIANTIPMGLHETHRVMMNTYLTFARLFQGSVKVQHLKGPVGIAHVGVILADRGFVWLLFFMALISVNLAVINFLPMPIADGGHMVFLIYEQLTGRPPSVRFQNAAAIAGLIVIGTVFLIVTFNDVGSVFVDLKRFFRG